MPCLQTTLYPLKEACYKQGLISETLMNELFEAQAALGGLKDPTKSGTNITVAKALKKGLIDEDIKNKVEKAGHAFSGYGDHGLCLNSPNLRGTDIISDEKLEKLLNVQYASGGVVDPKVKFRILDEGMMVDRCLVEEDLMEVFVKDKESDKNSGSKIGADYKFLLPNGQHYSYTKMLEPDSKLTGIEENSRVLFVSRKETEHHKKKMENKPELDTVEVKLVGLGADNKPIHDDLLKREPLGRDNVSFGNDDEFDDPTDLVRISTTSTDLGKKWRASQKTSILPEENEVENDGILGGNNETFDSNERKWRATKKTSILPEEQENENESDNEPEILKKPETEKEAELARLSRTSGSLGEEDGDAKNRREKRRTSRKSPGSGVDDGVDESELDVGASDDETELEADQAHRTFLAEISRGTGSIGEENGDAKNRKEKRRPSRKSIRKESGLNEDLETVEEESEKREDSEIIEKSEKSENSEKYPEKPEIQHPKPQIPVPSKSDSEINDEDDDAFSPELPTLNIETPKITDSTKEPELFNPTTPELDSVDDVLEQIQSARLSRRQSLIPEDVQETYAVLKPLAEVEFDNGWRGTANLPGVFDEM